MNKIYIVDAVNYLFRSYYAISPMTNGTGGTTNALYGFIRSLQKLLKLVQPEHLVCVFDGPDNKQSRQSIYTEYKSHRKEGPEDLFPQIDWARQYCTLAGIPFLCVNGVEADDVMASVALWAKSQGATSYLCTSDKDMAQLVDDQIFMMLPQKDYQLVDAQKVFEIYGVHPHQILDYLSIMGDASDNIPGIPGFGPKTASSLLAEFGTLDELLAFPEKVKGEKKQQLLREHKEVALMSRQLATLQIDVEIPKTDTFYMLKAPDINCLTEFYHQMQFSSLSRELEAPKTEEPPRPNVYTCVDTPEKLHALIDRLNQQQEVALLVEPVGIAFAYEPHVAWYVPHSMLDQLPSFFDTFQGKLFGHDVKKDKHVLDSLGLKIRNVGFDTMLASYLLEPQAKRHGLDDLVLEKFKIVKTPREALLGKGKNKITWQEVPLDLMEAFACEAVDYIVRLKRLFEKELVKRGLEKVFHEIELPLLPVLAEMEKTGIYLDTDCLQKIGQNLIQELHRIEKKIYEEVGAPFNLNSPKQLSDILFTQLGLKKPTTAKTAYATGADVLEELALENPIAKDILTFRGLEKLRTTYVEALPLAVHPKTKRVHCTFNQTVTATGRLSCQDPNLQNIPTRTKQGNSIRSCFKPEQSDWSYVGSDYSQIELRLLAHFSEDPDLIKAFQDQEDIHAHTASRIFNLPITMITPEMRNAAKTVNFGIIYGQGPFGLSQQLGISTREAADFIKKYFERYPKISDFLESCKQSARENGYSTTLTGRQRPIPELTNKNLNIKAAAERLAVNTPLQGTAADLIKLAMIAIDQEIQQKKLRGKMILQIHDELIFEVPDNEIDIFKKLIKNKMETIFKLKVPIIVNISVGKNWAEC
jgi:DNA polymerase I